MKTRLTFLLKTYLWTMLVFIIAKAAFMFFNQTGHHFTMTDMWQVWCHGLTLDGSTSLYILFIPFLLTLISVWWYRKWIDRVLRVYFAIISLALALAFVADTSLYPFWGFKLNASCLQYLETPTEAMASVSTGYLIARIIALLSLNAFILWGYPHLQRQESVLKSRIYETLFYLLLIPVMVIGVRGGLSESTTNIGQVYYSQDQFLNHSAINPVFSFLASFEKSANHIVDYEYYSEDECHQLMEGLYSTASVNSDTLLICRRPDIVVILMESAGEVFADAMPRLQQLKREGVYFSQCYANSWRTDRGTVCTFSGYPSFPTSSVMKMPNKTRQLPNIASTLKAEGYQTTYIYGGDVNFTNMRSYLISGGFQRVIWMKDYPAEEQASARWGVRDDITFQTLYDLITAQHTQPLFIGFSTLSSHEPWDVPIHEKEDEQANGFYYLDQCIDQFIDQLKQTPQWKNTLIILLPDHSIEHQEINQTDIRRNHIPMVWTGGAIKTHRDINVYCNQTDLVATLLAQLGMSHDQYPWSRDVLSQSYQYPFIMHTYDNGFSVIDSTGFMVFDFDARRIVTNQTPDVQRLERMGKAILQATTKDLKER